MSYAGKSGTTVTAVRADESVHRNMTRTLKWVGFALLGMGLGTLLGVGLFGPAILGEAFGNSRLRSLNNRIRGVFALESIDLGWTGEGKVHGLRLPGHQNEDLLHGDLSVPALASAQWRDGLLPTEATFSLESLRLEFDKDGVCSLLDRLAARAGVMDGSPFLDADYLNRSVHYQGTIEALTFADKRAPGLVDESTGEVVGVAEIVLSGVSFNLRWDPQGASQLQLRCALPSDGEFTIDLNWKGMGSSFDLQTLQGSATCSGASSVIEKILGLNGGLAMLFGPRIDWNLALGGRAPGGGGILVECEASGGEDTSGKLTGFFDGKHWKLGREFHARPEEMVAETESRVRIYRPELYSDLLAGLSSNLFGSLASRIFYQQDDTSYWRLNILRFVSGISSRDATLPFLAGWFAGSEIKASVNSADLWFGSRDEESRTEDHELNQSEFLWDYDPVAREGYGRLICALSDEDKEKAKMESNFIKVAGMGSGQSIDVLFEEVDIGWTSQSPIPGGDFEFTNVKFENLPSGLLPDHMGLLGASLMPIVGNYFVFHATRELVPGRDLQDGEDLPGWRLSIAGDQMDPESPIDFYTDSEFLWSEPGLRPQFRLALGFEDGMFDEWFAPMMPWFEELGPEQDTLLVQCSELLARFDGTAWRLIGGQFEVSGTIDYEVHPNWVRLLGKEGAEGFDYDVAFTVRGGEVEYDRLTTPVGTFAGRLDLVRERAVLRFEAPNELFLFGEPMAKGTRLSGPFDELVSLAPTD